ncbi:MAG: prepilin-type N-terminal cleavage/methylation domain-containing protein, partial [Candidatus Daviesbacteria bacterium]|nr:prepilin-type N-terminal cleavage/methylation domain-containing protein [Candidatus Daviesbacteria bacterium]
MRNDKGQSLIEVIVAATVGILVVSALTFTTIFSLRNANLAKNSAQATKLAQEGIEKVRSIRDRDIDGKVAYTDAQGNQITKFSQLWIIKCSQNNCYFYLNSSDVLSKGNDPGNGHFKKQVLIEDDSPADQQKKITVIVTWTDFSGSHESRLTTILRRL